jgi:fructokinase
MRIGIDLGGTKIEALAMDYAGRELLRYRVDSPRDDYRATIRAMIALVHRIEAETGATGTVGAGIPGSVSRRTGLIKNSNSTWLNGKPFAHDLSAELGREVRVANDANCLAVSEATDGSASGGHVVFGVILGTGCGGGVAIDGRIHPGPSGVGGEWGHNPLPWAAGDELPGPVCYCGKRGCLEMWVSGSGVARDFRQVTGRELTTRQIFAQADAGAELCLQTVQLWEDRLARGLASVINILDPDVLVFGGGLSHSERIYANLPANLPKYVFGCEAETVLAKAKYGDSSGVRGAAWLWPAI